MTSVLLLPHIYMAYTTHKGDQVKVGLTTTKKSAACQAFFQVARASMNRKLQSLLLGFRKELPYQSRACKIPPRGTWLPKSLSRLRSSWLNIGSYKDRTQPPSRAAPREGGAEFSRIECFYIAQGLDLLHCSGVAVSWNSLYVIGVGRDQNPVPHI